MDSERLPAALRSTVAAQVAFDRFYFNLHASSRQDPFLVLGVGIYPLAGLVDGYVCAVEGGEALQRNLRISTTLEEGRSCRLGPLTWAVKSRRPEISLSLEPNPSGIELDMTWTARAPLYEIEEYRREDLEGVSSFEHLFQSGRYEGWISIGGNRKSVDGWLGARDRSRGSRRTRDRLGMHLWVQAQMDDACVGFLFNEDRNGHATHCDGAVMHVDGKIDRVLSVRHDLIFNSEFELVSGTFELGLDNGATHRLGVRCTGPGIFMEAAGYAGWHGVFHGRDCLEHENWPFDGMRTPRNLDLSLTDALCVFEWGGGSGAGISEYALTRSPTYTYRPTLQM